MATHKRINKATTGANAVFYVVFVIVVLIALNLIASRVTKRIDFTEDHVFTLSKASKEAVRTLPDTMTAKAFISKDLTARNGQVAQYLRDLLDEYAAASGGKFTWEAIDPSTEALKEEANKLGVRPFESQEFKKEKFTAGLVYCGVAFQYQGKVEALPAIGTASGIEYQMTILIKNLSVKKKKIGVASSEGELAITQGPQGHGGGLTIVAQSVKDYQLEGVSLTGKLLADDIDALLIAGPRQAMTERAKFVVDQFLMRGKAVAFLVDGMVIETPQGNAAPGADQPQLGRKNDHGLDDLLEHYGFKIHDDVVMEPQMNAPGVVMLNGRQVLANYYIFTVVKRIDPTHPITAQVKGLIIPAGSSVEQLKDKQPGLKITALAQSTPDAWRQAGLFVLDPKSEMKPGPDRGPFNYAYAAEGAMTSFFAGKEHPNEKGEKVPPASANVSVAPGEEKVLETSQGPARFVVVGDSGFTSDETFQLIRYVPTYGANFNFTSGILDWLVADATMSELRAKTMQSRPLSIESASTASILKFGNLIGIPLLFALYGVIRARMRRSWRHAVKL